MQVVNVWWLCVRACGYCVCGVSVCFHAGWDGGDSGC